MSGDGDGTADEMVRAVLIELASTSLDAHIKDQVATIVSRSAEVAMSLGTMTISMELIGRLKVPHEHSFPKERAEAIYETVFSQVVAPLPTMLKAMLSDEEGAEAVLPLLQRGVDLAHAVYKGEYARRLDEALKMADAVVPEHAETMKPVSFYGDVEAVGDGVIVDISDLGLRRHRGPDWLTYNRMTRALFDTLTEEVGIRRPDDLDDAAVEKWDSAHFKVEVAFIVERLLDTAGPGEPVGAILLAEWSGRDVWAVENEVAGYTLMFPSDY